MKTLVVGLLIFFSILCGCATGPNQASSPSASTSANAKSTPDNSTYETGRPVNSIKIGKVVASSAGGITVEILNRLKKPVKVWEDSNSWGAACWRVVLVRKGEIQTFYQNPDQLFTVNIPAADEIAAGGHLKQKLDLNGGNWCGLGHCSRYNERGFGGNQIGFESDDMLIVIYDVPVTQEARDLGVWYGVIAGSNEPLRAGSNTPNQPNTATHRSEALARPVEKSMNALNITKLEISRAGQATLQLENSSKAALKIWKDSNSWGAACWRVLLIRNGSLEVFFQNPDQEFTRNGPAFDEIPGGGHLDQKLDLNGGNWCGMGHCSIHSERGLGGKTMTFESNDTVIVIYDVPATQEARDLGVWYRVIAASTTVQ